MNQALRQMAINVPRSLLKTLPTAQEVKAVAKVESVLVVQRALEAMSATRTQFRQTKVVAGKKKCFTCDYRVIMAREGS